MQSFYSLFQNHTMEIFNLEFSPRNSHMAHGAPDKMGVLRIIPIFLFLDENICCDPSSEPSQREGSNDGSQDRFLWRNMTNYP